jgi:hypothetical protein
LILTVDCGEDVRVVEDELEVEVAKVIGFDVIPSRETVQKDHHHLKVARQSNLIISEMSDGEKLQYGRKGRAAEHR